MLDKQKNPFDLPKLPPSINYGELIEQLTQAHASIARLDETFKHLKNPTLIEKTFLTREAVLSSRIEGTQATIEEVFKEEVENGIKEEGQKGRDIKEILNYRRALAEGVKLIDSGEPLSENNVKKLHRILLQSVRGEGRAPGEFRKVKVYIAPLGAPETEARYVPPLPPQIPELYSNFDNYLNTKSERDLLVQIAISHYQFEAIHPFKDGNGRVGRLLIPLFLYKNKLLSRPYVYISKYLEENRRDYYNLLADVSRNNTWTEWIRFFLIGLYEQANDANILAGRIIALQNEYESHLSDFNSPYALDLLEAGFMYPYLTTKLIRKHTAIKNEQTVLNLVKKFVDAGIFTDILPKRKRNKVYSFSRLLNLIRDHRSK